MFPFHGRVTAMVMGMATAMDMWARRNLQGGLNFGNREFMMQYPSR